MQRQPLRRGFGLIEILVVVVVIGIVATLVATPMLMGSRDKKDQRVMSPKERARGVECMSYLQQIRQAIMMYVTSDERPPATLQELRSYQVNEQMQRCPDSQLPYQYDPANGAVRCLTEGHERY